MEVLNLLKIWKSSSPHDEQNSTASLTEISLEESENEFLDDDDDGDEGEDSFFELEITTPNSFNEQNTDSQNHNQNVTESTKNHHHFYSESNHSRCKCSRILPIEPKSPISILKSNPKLKFFSFGLGSKLKKTERQNRASFETQSPNRSNQEPKQITLGVNFVEEELGRSFPMLARLSSSSKSTFSNLQKQSTNETSPNHNTSSKRFSKESVQKYLKLIKPFYVKVSKRYNDRVKLSDLLYISSPAASPSQAPAMVGSPKNFVGGFKVLSKHLGKSRSASAGVGIVSPAASRRDDSLLQQQDEGIESAILHCKRSFNSSRECSLLSRCTSDTSFEILTEPWRKSTEELDGF